MAWRRWISPRRSEPHPALDTAVRFLAQRPRSEYEVRRHLRRARVDEAVIESVLDQLRTHRLVDDDAFARYWVEQRRTFRPRGVRLLQAELRQHGVEAAIAQDAATAAAPAAEEDAYRAAGKRAFQLRGLDERSFRSRLYQWLVRRGFDTDTSVTTVNRLWTEVALDRDMADLPTTGTPPGKT